MSLRFIDRQSSLQTSQKEHSDRIPFTLTFHPHNHSVKSIILKNFKLLQNDPETGTIFSQPPLISFKRDQNKGNFLVRSSFQTNDQPGTFKCTRTQCKTCPFIPPGGTPWNFWWGCAARISKSRPNFRPKHAIFPTRFQTWPHKSIPVFRPHLVRD